MCSVTHKFILDNLARITVLKSQKKSLNNQNINSKRHEILLQRPILTLNAVCAPNRAGKGGCSPEPAARAARVTAQHSIPSINQNHMCPVPAGSSWLRGTPPPSAQHWSPPYKHCRNNRFLWQNGKGCNWVWHSFQHTGQFYTIWKLKQPTVQKIR